MKSTAWAIFAVSLLLLLVGSVAGVIGLRYPRVLENEPLVDPVEVIGIDGNLIFLADSRVIELRTVARESLRNAITDSDCYVDIKGCESFVTIHARKKGGICRTAWTQPIRIPLFPETVYRNRREMIGFGKCTRME